jgi:hypothetical protein
MQTALGGRAAGRAGIQALALAGALAVALGTAACREGARAPDAAVHEYAHLLSAEEVARVAGRADVTLVERDPEAGAGGDLNFALPDGTPLLMVVLQPGAYYEDARERFAARELQGVGEAAFAGPQEGPAYLVVVRAGDRSALLASSLGTYDERGLQPHLSEAQLAELASLVAGRL